LAAALRFAKAGARIIQVVDLDGAKEGRVVNWPSLSEILALDNLEIQFGGGIRTTDDALRVFELGTTRILVGSVAISSPRTFEQWVERFGADRFCVTVDVRNGTLVSHGWLTEEDASFADVVTRVQSLGVRRLLCTDVSRDGTLAGPNIELYRTVVKQFPALEWTAAGGVRSKDDLFALQQAGIDCVVLGKALHNDRLKLDDLQEFLC
jgi:phosphoribosylformimino-5-aminoimidazole carboxamide ribotide isomerase